MKAVASDGNFFILSAERGEELIGSLITWTKENGVKGATLVGLGAADKLELAYYDLETKKYERHQIDEEVEILSLIGNLTTLEGEKIIHLHGNFGKRDLSTFGGHIFKLRVSGACEIHLTRLSKSIQRSFDQSTGLNLLCSAEIAD